MLLEILVNIIIILIGLYLLLKEKTKKKYSTKVLLENRNFIIFALPLSAIFTLRDSNLYLILLILVYLTYKDSISTTTTKIFWRKLVTNCIKRVIYTWPLFFILSVFSTQAFEDFTEQSIVTKIREMDYSTELILILVMVIIISPVIEEIYFRRLIYGVLKKFIGMFWACVVTSIIFAIIHMNLHAFPVLFFLGIVLNCIYENDGTLISPIIFHSLFNTIMIILILF